MMRGKGSDRSNSLLEWSHHSKCGGQSAYSSVPYKAILVTHVQTGPPGSHANKTQHPR